MCVYKDTMYIYGLSRTHLLKVCTNPRDTMIMFTGEGHREFARTGLALDPAPTQDPCSESKLLAWGLYIFVD